MLIWLARFGDDRDRLVDVTGFLFDLVEALGLYVVGDPGAVGVLTCSFDCFFI